MNSRKKHVLAIMLCGMLLLTACGETDTSSAETSNATTSPTATSSSICITGISTNTNSSDITEPTTTTTTTIPTTTPTPQEVEPPEEEAPESVVELSHSSGIYADTFELTLSSAEDGEIYYTTDGSDPCDSETAVLYTAPIAITDRSGDKNVVSAVDPVQIAGSFCEPNRERNGFVSIIEAPSDEDVDKCTVIRAAVRKADGSTTGITAATYFIGTAEEHINGISESCAASGTDLAVISITMEYDDLFDPETGIYVKGNIFDQALEDYLAEKRRVRDGETARQLDANYKQRGREWEREASVTMFEFSPDGAEEVINQSCGIRIQGNYSRSDIQKGLRLYARNEYGDNNFRYAVFGEEYLNDSGDVMDKFKTLVLRAGGNCAFTTKFNDTYWQSLLHDSACDTKQSRPCVVYLNGEYWGLYVLEEDYTDDFMEDVHGVEKDNVVIYKGDAETYEIGYKLDEGELPDGENEDYYFMELTNFFANHTDLKSSADFEEFSKLVDTDSVMDYFAVQIWINNKWDWPGKNWSMWKTTETDPSNPYADGRWRFMFYDMDFGGVSGGNEAGTNTIKEDNYKKYGLLDMDTDNPAVLCFAYLMTNEGWREGFYTRLRGLAENEFEKSAALEKLEWFEDVYSPLFDSFFERYPDTGNTDDALNGGYASSACIRDFINKRGNSIERMIKWCENILNK